MVFLFSIVIVAVNIYYTFRILKRHRRKDFLDKIMTTEKKFKQIQVINTETGHLLFALAEDGSIWMRDVDGWEEVEFPDQLKDDKF